MATPAPLPRLLLAFFAALLPAVAAHTATAQPPFVAAVEGGIALETPVPVEPAGLRVGARPGYGVTVATDDERFSMTLRGRIQLRHTASFDGTDEPEHSTQVRTARIHLHGATFSPRIRYNTQLAFGSSDFDPAAPSPVLDAYVEYQGPGRLRLRAGQFFVPFGRARTNQEFAMQLIERQQAIVELTLDRDAGVMLWTRDALGTGGHLGLQLGVFGGEGRNVRAAASGGALVAGRVIVRPFGDFNGESEGDLERRRNPGMALGASVAYNADAQRTRGTNGPVYTFARFDHLNVGADALLKVRGFSLMTEVLWRRTDAPWRERIDGDAGPERAWAREGWGWLVQAGQMVTDQVEISARWDELHAAPGTDPALRALVRDQGREAGAGISWYVNGHRLKLQADWGVRFAARRQDATLPEHEVKPRAQVARAALDVSF